MARGRAILINDNYEMLVQPVRDSTGKIVSGLVLGNTLYQNTGLILAGKKGFVKEQPALGIAIDGVLLDDDYMQWRRTIRLQLELDQQKVMNVIFNTANNLQITASY
jgi:hypothetical protein